MSCQEFEHWFNNCLYFSEDEGDKERDKFVKRFTPHIYNVSPTGN